MTLPAFIPSISSEIESVIQSKLAALEAEHDVRVLFAIESGSGAWGFPSPDSDYDVRFIYAHQPDWYLSIEPGRDVIELPIEGDWDINGWDIRKALGLLIKPNPVMLEWLSSPIRYRWNDDVCTQLTEFAAKTIYGESCLHHYRNLAQKQWDKHVGDSEEVSFKKYFYILRPALAISWIRQIPDTPPPMNLHDLVAGQQLSSDLITHIDELLVLKSKAKEIGRGLRIAMIDDFIQDQMAWATVVAKKDERPDLTAEGDRLLRGIVKDDWKS
jgi:predicted nucleotidyltransferase